MPYTNEDGDRLNNFASEPKMYTADPLTSQQKTTYLLVGVGTVLLMGGLIAFASFVS